MWELCSDWYAHGACRYELWCQCLHSSGGPLRSVVKVVPTLRQALEACEVLEAAEGGIKGVADGSEVGADGGRRVGAVDGVGGGELPY